jgi:hypothetical protein
VYLASPAGPGQAPVYAVSSNVNKATAVDDIVAAMKDGTMLTFQVYDASGTGAGAAPASPKPLAPNGTLCRGRDAAKRELV